MRAFRSPSSTYVASSSARNSECCAHFEFLHPSKTRWAAPISARTSKSFIKLTSRRVSATNFEFWRTLRVPSVRQNSVGRAICAHFEGPSSTYARRLLHDFRVLRHTSRFPFIVKLGCWPAPSSARISEVRHQLYGATSSSTRQLSLRPRRVLRALRSPSSTYVASSLHGTSEFCAHFDSFI